MLVSSHIKNKIIIGLVDDNVATIPASAFFNAINNKLIPNAMPKKPLIKDLIIIEKFIEIGDVKYLDLEVYKDMAIKELTKIKDQAFLKWNLVDCLVLHRYGKLEVNEKIVLVVCLSEHRKDSFESCKFIMDYLKKNAPFWKKEFYKNGSSWLENSSQY